jgi:hypothetical protein
MMRYGETIHSMLPQDIPWFLPDHAIFFGLVYSVLIVLGVGFGCVVMKSVWDAFKECGGKSIWDPSEDCSEKH